MVEFISLVLCIRGPTSFIDSLWYSQPLLLLLLTIMMMCGATDMNQEMFDHRQRTYIVLYRKYCICVTQGHLSRRVMLPRAIQWRSQFLSMLSYTVVHPQVRLCFFLWCCILCCSSQRIRSWSLWVVINSCMLSSSKDEEYLFVPLTESASHFVMV